MLDIKPVQSGRITLSAKNNTVILAGSIDVANPNEIMQPFFNAIHEAVLNDGLKEVQVDIRELTFLNSCGIKEIVAWILRQDELTEDKKYKIVFLCSSNYSWQELTIASIIWLNPHQVKMERIN